jgi:hypothetical protein
MKRTFKTFLFLLSISFLTGFESFSQSRYQTTKAEISFFAKAPVSDISATTNSVIASYDAVTNRVKAEVMIVSFDFPRTLMKQHFNNRYMESEKFPSAIFEGVLDKPLTLSLSATNKTQASGNLTIHGVTARRTIPITVVVSNVGLISITGKFTVPLRDHNIEIPTLFFKEITESIDVSIKLDLTQEKI